MGKAYSRQASSYETGNHPGIKTTEDAPGQLLKEMDEPVAGAKGRVENNMRASNKA